MMQRLKLFVMFGLMWLNIFSAFARNTTTVYKNTQFQRHGAIIALKLNIDFTDRNAPLEELAAALKNNPTVSQFKISWIAVVGGGNYRGVAIYNRAKQTVNLYAYETFEETIYRYHRVYSPVGEAVLVKVVQLHKTSTAADNGPSVFGFFNDSTKYGCKQQKLDAN